MPHYVEGFVVPVPKDRIAEYRKLARRVGKLFMEHGALSVTECLADDVKPGKWTSFPQSVKLKDGETVVFSWITYRSRKHRDSIAAKVMKDARMDMDPSSFPFDGKRMIFGGFKTMLEL
jgi:uncharacterized protein YbaA (DUF1428 family)